MLRLFFKYKRSLLSNLCLCAVQAILKYLRVTTGLKLMPGIIAVIQTFGSRMNFHPHLHVLTTEGGQNQDGIFHKVPRFNDSLISELFTKQVFSLLLRHRLIGIPLLEKTLHWQHTGFNVHSKVRAREKREVEKIGKYMARLILSIKKLFFDETKIVP